jgi:rod shape determining protein RodA
MKIVYVLALAWYLRYRRNFRTLFGLVAPFVLTLIPMALILIQPDLGTVLLFLPVLFAMLYSAGAKVKHLSIIVLLALLSAPFFWFQIKSYQRLRVIGVVLQSQKLRDYLIEHPKVWEAIIGQRTVQDADEAAKWRSELTEWDRQSGYQLMRSKTAIGSGGLLGQGWNKGVFVEYDFLPEKHNDLIFAMIGHQWGLLGTVLVILCYAAIVIIGFDVATLTNDPFGRLVAVGLSTMLAAQAITNLCMAVGIGPITGITLPFVSAGGSSIISSFLCIGLLISVAHRRPMLIANPPFVFDEEAERYQVSPR